MARPKRQLMASKTIWEVAEARMVIRARTRPFIHVVVLLWRRYLYLGVVRGGG